MRKLLSMIFWLALATGASAQGDPVLATAYQTTNVRGGPGTQFEVVGQLAADESVPVIGRDHTIARWLQVLLPDEVIGWVAAFTVEVLGDLEAVPVVGDETPPEGAEVRIIAYGRVNVRSGPGILFDVVGELDVDDEALAVARSTRRNDWLYIQSEALSGWVAYFTVIVDGDADGLPVRVPDVGGEDLVSPAELVRANFTIRLRLDPALEAEIAGQIPFDSRAAPLARTEAGDWIYIVFEEAEGWAQTRLFTMRAEQLDLLPVYTRPLLPTVTPAPITATPIPTATPQNGP